MLAPLETTFSNYGISNEKHTDRDLKKIKKNKDSPFEVQWIDGFAMLLNKKKINMDVYFDENFFMYLENNDLCRRVIDKGGSIFVIPKAKINHLAGKTVDHKFEKEIDFNFSFRHKSLESFKTFKRLQNKKWITKGNFEEGINENYIVIKSLKTT